MNWEPCKACTDPLHCGSWKTCYRTDPDAPRFLAPTPSRDQPMSVVSSADRAVYKHAAAPYTGANTLDPQMQIPNDPKVICKLLRAIAGSERVKADRHDTILIAAVEMIEAYERKSGSPTQWI